MKSRESGPNVVGIGTRIDQRNRKLEVAVPNCDLQGTQGRRSPPVFPALRGLHHRIHIDPCLDKRPHDVEAALAHGKQERRKSGIEAGAHVRSSIDQSAHDLGVALGRRPHQGRLVAPLALIGGGAMREQCLHRLGIPGPRSQHQGRLPAPHSGIRVGSSLQQQLYDRGVAIRAGLCQG